jgi:hypothetical protein
VSVHPIWRIPLSRREFEFVEYASLGLTVPNIALVMGLSPQSAYCLCARLVRDLRRRAPKVANDWTKGWTGEALLRSLWKDDEAERTYLLQKGSQNLPKKQFEAVRARYESLATQAGAA